MLISLISKASDYSVDGIGYIIKSVENKTVYVDKITFSGDIVIPDKVQINNYWFTVDSIGNIDNSPESSSLKINGVIKTNGRSLYGYRTACFYVDESNPYMKAEDGILYSKDMKRLIRFPSRKRISEFTIPESVSAIDDYSFGDNKYLTRLIFNDNIEDLPENFIYGSDFSGKLKYLKLSDKIKVIHGRCLNYYPTLEEIVLPKDLEEVEKDPHYGYYGLPNELETVTISNSKIANYSYKLEPSTFVFSRFSKLKNLHVDDPNPVALDNNVFTEGKYFTINIYVPAGTKEIYQNTDGWKNFFNIIEESAPQYKLSYIVDGKEYKTYMLDYGTAITPEPAPTKEDFIFSGWSEIPKTMPDYDVTVTGTFSDGVDAEVKLNKNKATIEKGRTLTLKATVTPETLTDKSVTWKSSDTKVATVTSAGKVKGIKAGTTTITCTSKATGAKATCKVTVGYVKLDKTEAAILKGKTVTLAATVYPSSLTDKTVTWESSNTKIATVTSAGKVKGVKAGTATITCTSKATGLKATCTVNVVKGFVTLNKTEAYIEKGKTTTLKATVTPTTLTDKSVTWTSSDKSIATVSSSGKVKGVKYGTATITCTSKATGASATCKVTVGKVVVSITEVSIKKSRGITLEATVYPTTLTDKSVTWTSSDKSVATVSSSGKVKGIKAGTATITCTSVATGLKGSCKVTVLAVAESRSAIGDDDGTTGIEDLDEKPAVEEPYDVYDLSGRKVANQVTSLDGLPKGIYIVNGKKVMKK